jgi:N-carbamoylputrescine amidase
MSRKIKIALVQQHATTELMDNLDRGVLAFETAVNAGAQLVVFAELAFTPFYPQATATDNMLDIAETIPGPTTDIFCQLARRHQVVTVLNLFERRSKQTFDSSPVIDADGSILGITRMVHILEAPFFHEKGYYTPATGEDLVFKTQLGHLGVAICYDRHFPEYMRILALKGAELVAVPQAGAVDEWPPGLFEAEMQVAAFQNGYFVALCNRVGEEESLTFEGKSFVASPSGIIIDQAPAAKDHILISEIDLDMVKSSQASVYFLPDRREDVYNFWEIEKKKDDYPNKPTVYNEDSD